MHRSRSPFMALAVTAMIGRFLSAGTLRISRMVSKPSISGIMMSMSTASISDCFCSKSIASRPLPADMTIMPCSSKTVDKAKMLRISSSTIRIFLSAKTLSDWCKSTSRWRARCGKSATLRCKKKAVWSSKRSGEWARRNVHTSASFFQLAVVETSEVSETSEVCESL